jgi:hypothetical protein
LRYIDSGARDPAHALGTWLNTELTDEVEALRIQSGFFSENGLAPFLATFKRLAESDAPVRIVVGSNDGGTLAPHLSRLVKCLGMPRAHAELGVVYCGGGFFHSKTFHFRRTDGSQAAYVGSANLSWSGIGATHIEAGVLLDTRHGDNHGILSEIAPATDAWFEMGRPGFERIESDQDVVRLEAEGVLRATRPPSPPRPAGAEGKPPARPGLKPLLTFGGFGDQPAEEETVETAGGFAPKAGPAGQPKPLTQQVAGYPPFIVFAPGATAPTSGADALSGAPLPNGTGLIVRISSDTDRLWRGAAGTANFTIPTLAAPTLRFGWYRQSRPRAELDIEVRYISAATFNAAPAPSNVMAYGYGPNPTGNKDLRLVIPVAPINEISPHLAQHGLPVPKAGDLAILEWPVEARPTFRMTFVDPAADLATALSQSWGEDRAQNHVAGRSSTWLRPDLSPTW